MTKLLPYEGMNLDHDETLIKPSQAKFIKGLQDIVGQNPLSGSQSDNGYVFTPTPNPVPYAVDLPPGDNYSVGFHEHKEKGHGYVFVYNSEGDHSIYRIRGKERVCEKVLQSRCLNFQFKPEHFIKSPGRCTVVSSTRLTPDGQLEDVDYLIFSDYYNENRFICVQDAIETGGFNSEVFPFFASSDADCSPCTYISLAVKKPAGLISFSPVPRLSEGDEGFQEDKAKPNLLNYNGWQFVSREIDVWGRESEYSDVSDLYYNTSIANNRSLKLRVNAGCPIVSKIEILIRYNKSDWYLFETIYKYPPKPQKKWYELEIDPALNYNSSTNEVEYIFSADKVRLPVDQKVVSRVTNPIPLKSSTVFPVNRQIALGRNLRGYNPLSLGELAKAKYSVTPPYANSYCDGSRKIAIYAILYNPYDAQIARLRTHEGNMVFGIGNCYGARDSNPFMYGQVLPKDQEGIIGYLVGTGKRAISTQWKRNATTGEMQEIGAHGEIEGGWFAVQKWEFTAIPGKYVFRIASHKASLLDDYEKTSTKFVGLGTYDGRVTNRGTEIIIDCCGQDVDLINSPAIIYDASHAGKGCGVVDRTGLVEGYLYESEKEKIPIEAAQIDSSADYRLYYTDHNGYYFAFDLSKGVRAKLLGYKDCNPSAQLAETRETYDSPGAFYRDEKLYAYRGELLYPKKDRYLIKGKVTLCDHPETGVPGALVVLTNGGTGVTNSQGQFVISAHRKGGTLNQREETIIFSQRGAVQLLACGSSCNYCFPQVTCRAPVCGPEDSTVEVTGVTARINGYDKKGPTMGGRYLIGFSMEDWAGRSTFVQTAENHFVNIPSLQQTGMWDFSRVLYDISAITFPLWVKNINFYCANLSEKEYLMWAIDRVELIDVTGKPNSSSPAFMRLYYEGLREYNKQNNFSTNTAWDFLTPTEVQEVVMGDEIEIVANGDGKIFSEHLRFLVSYDKAGKYIQIEYDSRLKDLTEGALVKLLRPRLAQDQQFFFMLPKKVKVKGGIAQEPIGEIPIVDSYLVNRQIPVPVEIKKIEIDDEGNEIETSEIDNELRSFPFPFMHHSPSDLWGDHLNNFGRVSGRNRDEKQRLLRTEIMVSGVLSLTGTANGLPFFTDEKAVVFDEQEWGGITLCVVGVGIVVVWCELRNFISSFDDNRVYANSDGGLTANSGQIFSRPERRGGSQYGLQMPFLNTLQEMRGVIGIVDAAKEAVVVHDFSSCVDITEELGIRGWLSDKIKGLLPNKYLHAGYDPKRGEYLLSDAYLGTRNTVLVCPVDYTLQDRLCVKISSTPATPPTGNGGSPGIASSEGLGNVLWGEKGAYIMKEGFQLNGSGQALYHLTTPHFWLNGDAPGVGANTTYGKVNETAVWVQGSVNGAPYNESIGFSRKFNVPVSKRYYVGLAGDNTYSLKLNGVSLLENVLSISSPAVGSNFRAFMIYPVDLIAGDNFIEMTAINISGPEVNPGALCAEIYDNTAEEIANATSNQALTILFSTKNMVGQPFDVGETIGYKCPPGWALSVEDGVYQCKMFETVNPVVVDDSTTDDQIGYHFNGLPQPNPLQSETIVLSLERKIAKRFEFFVPEYFGAIESDSGGRQLISFVDAGPWRHNDKSAGYGMVYYKESTWYMTLVANAGPDVTKLFFSQNLLVKDAIPYSDFILTERGQRSYLMPFWWEKIDDTWWADFKCAVNSIKDENIEKETTDNALLDGDPLSGRWLLVRYRGKGEVRYFELMGAVIHPSG